MSNEPRTITPKDDRKDEVTSPSQDADVLSQQPTPAHRYAHNNMFVRCLPPSMTEKEVREAFQSAFGPIHSLKLVMDTQKNRSRGLAFVTFEHKTDAENAERFLATNTMFGRKLEGKISRKGPGSGGGGSNSGTPKNGGTSPNATGGTSPMLFQNGPGMVPGMPPYVPGQGYMTPPFMGGMPQMMPGMPPHMMQNYGYGSPNPHGPAMVYVQAPSPNQPGGMQQPQVQYVVVQSPGGQGKQQSQPSAGGPVQPLVQTLVVDIPKEHVAPPSNGPSQSGNWSWSASHNYDSATPANTSAQGVDPSMAFATGMQQ